jgi:death-on-curing protein
VIEEPVSVNMPEVLVAHSRQLGEHGGSDGVRELTLLESALAKPRNVLAYQPDATFPRLAASYAFGIARNHPFIDGNKRTALVVSEGFLRFNGLKIVASPEEKYLTFVHLADGSLSEEDLAAWLAAHAVRM